MSAAPPTPAAAPTPQPTAAPATSLSDFSLLSRLGEGSYSEVYLARHDATGALHALKVVSKAHVLRHGAVHQVRRERDALSRLADPGIVRLHFTFQDDVSLYFALEHCPGGELYDQVRAWGRLPIPAARFYAAETVLILGALRAAGLVHRDLKPENLLLDGGGHLKLADFGSVRDLAAPPGQYRDPAPGGSAGAAEPRTASFVGTADYVSPEVLGGRAAGPPADLWALGCLLFQMLTGKPPFKAASEYLTFQKVVAGEYAPLPRGDGDDAVLEAAAADLVDRLLRLEPAERIGAVDLEDLKRHAFFEEVDWAGIRAGPAPTPVPVEEADEGGGAGGGFDWELSSMRAHKFDV